MKSLIRFTVLIGLFGSMVSSTHAAFTSLYVFGDGVCTTTNNPFAGQYYYGLRRSNGRVWVEVLAQRQGITYESNKNWSYFGHYSDILVTNVSNFPAPPDANTALFVVWVNDADFVGYLGNPAVFKPYTTNNIAVWTNAINQSLSNHFKVVTNLYAKGARTFILPTAVDLTKIPYYSGASFSLAEFNFIRQRIIDFNNGFAITLNQARATLPGVTIFAPDIFFLLDNVVAHASDYGLTNALTAGPNGPHTIDALGDMLLINKSLTGPGTNYIFWDNLNPTAKLHARIADEVQQLIAPVRINAIASLSGSNRLDLANIPVGRNGSVEGSTNFASWTTAAAIISTNATQINFVPNSGPFQFYRLQFPFTWSWP